MRIIKNFEELGVTELRRRALQVMGAGLVAIDTALVMEKIAARLPVKEFNRFFVVGVGKCALEAGRAIEKVWNDSITEGIAVDVRPGKLQKIRVYAGTHPYPTEANVDATKEIIKLLSDLTEKDLVVFIISGGGSTLLCDPLDVTCRDEAAIIECLSGAGATIEEINTVRKHLSLARGGFLAKYAHPAKVVSFIFSDVPSNNLEFVASGPTVKDTTTVADARAVIERYGVEKRCGFVFEGLIETPKEDRYFEKVENILAVTNEIALRAMAAEGEKLGFAAKIVTAELRGEARLAGEAIAEALAAEPKKTLLLYGGETTVTLKGKGSGGRNQELALSALSFIKEGELVAALNSDGRDNGDWAGAIADAVTGKKSKEMKLNELQYLENNNSLSFFTRTGDYILTGDTGANVSDLVVAIKE